MDAESLMSEFLHTMVVALVDRTEEVVIAPRLDCDGSTTFLVHVALQDIGKLIGKQGRTARSLRTILSAASMKYKRRFTVDIVEPRKAERAA